ncbi:MAG: transporter substrate-binding domain-containing protein [Magnetococcales bacterium]|nr:transporter substrate-binding domain-containing protein [Magnetococcales bacterium]
MSDGGRAVGTGWRLLLLMLSVMVLAASNVRADEVLPDSIQEVATAPTAVPDSIRGVAERPQGVPDSILGLEAAEIQRQGLVVGVTIAPPFVVRLQDGSLSGVSIDLWRAVARMLNLTYRFQELELMALMDAVEKGEVDVAAAALTINSERESRFDFSHAYYHTGFGVAVRNQQEEHVTGVVQRLLSMKFIEAVGGLALLLLAVGVVIWALERRGNQEQFPSSMARGVGAGFWWSAVTMTTVGYGDKAPRTFSGRVIGLIWMFASLIVISSFTAAITTALHETRNSGIAAVHSPADLLKLRLGAVKGSSGEEFLYDTIAPGKLLPSSAALLQSLSRGEVDAVVHDAPILANLVHRRAKRDLMMLPGHFGWQDYGFAFKTGSSLREPINRAMLDVMSLPAWKRIRVRHLGPGDASLF